MMEVVLIVLGLLLLSAFLYALPLLIGLAAAWVILSKKPHF